MEKETKNIITRAWLEKELRFYNTAEIRSALVCIVPFTFVFVPLTALFVFIVGSNIQNILVRTICCILIGGFTSCPVWLILLSLCVSLKERILLSNGGFDIITREVLRKGEKLDGFRYHREISEYLLFDGYPGIKVDHTEFQLASVGDQYYLVVYRSKKNVAILYSAKRYKYKES